MKYKKELDSFPEEANVIYQITEDGYEIKECEKTLFSELMCKNGDHFFKTKHDAAEALIFNMVNDSSKELMDMEFEAQDYEDKAEAVRKRAANLKSYIKVLSAMLPEDINEVVE